MKIEYNPMAEKLLVNGKHVKRGTKKWEEAVVEYICRELSLTKSLSEILPQHTGALPSFLDYTKLEKDPKYKAKFMNARENRVIYLREKLVQAMNRFVKSGDKIDKETYEGINKALEKLENTEVDNNVVLNITKVLPDDFFD